MLLVALLMGNACAGTVQDDPRDSIDAGREPLDGGVDAGEPVNQDAGVPDEEPDAGEHTNVPVDCEAAGASENPWCDEICAPFDIEAGWAERVRWFGRTAWSEAAKMCGNSGMLNKTGLVWRAPFSGRWVLDNFGAEGALFGAISDARCGGEELNCTGGWRQSVILDLEAGTPIIAESYHTVGESYGARIHRINISPWTTTESGADCLDGADNDGDGDGDCNDPDCAESAECTTPLCADEILSGAVPLVTEGELNFEDHPNRYRGCVGMARERVFAWQAPSTGRFVADMTGSNFRGRLSVRRGACTGPEIGICPSFGEPSGEKWSVSTAFEVAEGEWVYVMVSATNDSHAFGTRGQDTHYVLELRAWEEETGERCRDRLDNDGDGVFDASDTECGR